jgi:mannose/fructose/N-acetylgalactosamine-specific phosphotransferase system component IIC
LELLSLSLLGGLLALEGTSFGQFMASRPIVAATAAGWVLGDPGSGLLLGGMLELLHLSVMPVGGARFPELGPAAVVAVATAVAAGGGGGIALGCLMALAWGQLGGASIVLLRRVNGWIAPDPLTNPASPSGTEWRHLAATALDLARGTVLTVAGILVGVRVVAPVSAYWPLGRGATIGLVLVAAAMPAGALLRTFGGVRRRGVLFALGVLAGLVGSLLL